MHLTMKQHEMEEDQLNSLFQLHYFPLFSVMGSVDSDQFPNNLIGLLVNAKHGPEKPVILNTGSLHPWSYYL